MLDTADKDDEGTVVPVNDAGKAETLTGNSADSTCPTVIDGLHWSGAAQDKGVADRTSVERDDDETTE